MLLILYKLNLVILLFFLSVSYYSVILMFIKDLIILPTHLTRSRCWLFTGCSASACVNEYKCDLEKVNLSTDLLFILRDRGNKIHSVHFLRLS